jgi:hypothetical protein
MVVLFRSATRGRSASAVDCGPGRNRTSERITDGFFDGKGLRFAGSDGLHRKVKSKVCICVARPMIERHSELVGERVVDLDEHAVVASLVMEHAPVLLAPPAEDDVVRIGKHRLAPVLVDHDTRARLPV